MPMYSNAQILAAVLAQWAKPAIAQIASGKIAQMQWMQELQQGAIALGLVGSNYDISNEVAPLLGPAIETLAQPMIEEMLRKLPDNTLPTLAREIVKKAEEAGNLKLLDGLIVLDAADLQELRRLLDLNLPLPNINDQYTVKI